MDPLVFPELCVEGTLLKPPHLQSEARTELLINGTAEGGGKVEGGGVGGGGGVLVSCMDKVLESCTAGGGTHDMHGRSRMTIDRRIPTRPGWSMSGFHRPGRHCLHQARSAVGCSAGCMKGELHPTNNRL